jgi:hypothetical protein
MEANLAFPGTAKSPGVFYPFVVMMGEDVPLLFLFTLGLIGAAGMVVRTSDRARLEHQSPRRPGPCRLSGLVGREHARQRRDTAELLIKAEPVVFAVALAVGLFVAVLRVAMWELGL